MKPLTLPMFTIITLVLIGFQSDVQAQTFGGGWNKIVQGITGDRTPTTVQSGSKLLGLFGNSSNNSNETSGLGGLPNLMQGFGENQMGALGQLGQSNQPAQTDILSRMNQKSKDAIDRTHQWAQQKKQEMGSKMFSGALNAFKPQNPLGQGTGNKRSVRLAQAQG